MKMSLLFLQMKDNVLTWSKRETEQLHKLKNVSFSRQHIKLRNNQNLRLSSLFIKLLTGYRHIISASICMFVQLVANLWVQETKEHIEPVLLVTKK